MALTFTQAKTGPSRLRFGFHRTGFNDIRMRSNPIQMDSRSNSRSRFESGSYLLAITSLLAIVSLLFPVTYLSQRHFFSLRCSYCILYLFVACLDFEKESYLRYHSSSSSFSYMDVCFVRLGGAFSFSSSPE